MNKTPATELIAAVLKRIREAEIAVYGQPKTTALPRGLRNDPCQCVIGRALPLIFEGVDSRTVSCPMSYGDEAIRLAAAWDTQCRAVELPRDIKAPLPWLEIGLPIELGEFVTRFDAGEFPELVEPYRTAHD